ncbi:MAG: transglutaminaseTgpA domain-containing protein, partial [Herbaspirillum sp.]
MHITNNPTLFKWLGFQLPLARDKADTLLLLVSCLFVLAPQVVHLPWWISALVALLLIWRSVITLRGLRMPSRWVLLPLVLLASAGVYGQFSTIFGRDAGVALVVLLLAFKLLEMHARRDLFVVLYLSLFLLLTNFFYSQT